MADWCIPEDPPSAVRGVPVGIMIDQSVWQDFVHFPALSIGGDLSLLLLSDAYRIETQLAADVSWAEFSTADFREPPFRVSKAKRSIELFSEARAGRRFSRFAQRCNAMWIRLARTP